MGGWQGSRAGSPGAFAESHESPARPTPSTPVGGARPSPGLNRSPRKAGGREAASRDARGRAVNKPRCEDTALCQGHPPASRRALSRLPTPPHPDTPTPRDGRLCPLLDSASWAGPAASPWPRAGPFSEVPPGPQGQQLREAPGGHRGCRGDSGEGRAPGTALPGRAAPLRTGRRRDGQADERQKRAGRRKPAAWTRLGQQRVLDGDGGRGDPAIWARPQAGGILTFPSMAAAGPPLRLALLSWETGCPPPGRCAQWPPACAIAAKLRAKPRTAEDVQESDRPAGARLIYWEL